MAILGNHGVSIVGNWDLTKQQGHNNVVSLQLITVGKRHVQCPLYHSGTAGIDMTQQCCVPTSRHNIVVSLISECAAGSLKTSSRTFDCLLSLNLLLQSATSRLFQTSFSFSVSNTSSFFVNFVAFFSAIHQNRN